MKKAKKNINSFNLKKQINEKNIYLIALTAFAISVLYSLSKTIGWQIYWDTPPIHYTAWRILNGERLYSDVYDVNWPGSHLIHMLAITIFGESDLGFRIFDFFWILFIGFSIFLLFSKNKPIEIISALFCFIAYYIGSNITMMQQREIHMLPFIILSLHFFANYFDKKGARNLIYSGFFLGFSFFIKPLSALLAAVLFIYLTIKSYQKISLKEYVKNSALFGIGFASLPAIISIWLYKQQALLDFFNIAYVIHFKLYSNLYSTPFDKILITFFKTNFYIIPLLLASIFYAFTNKIICSRFSIILLGVLYGILHLFAQKKGWGQHHVIFFSISILAGFYFFSDLIKINKLKTSYFFLRFCILTLFLLSPLYFIKENNLSAANMNEIKQLENDLSAITKPGDYVQPFETMDGIINAIYNLKLLVPARSLHNFIFFNSPNTSYGKKVIQNLKNDFVKRIQDKNVKIIVFKEWYDEYNHRNLFPEFYSILNSNYSLYKRSGTYLIYIKKDFKFN